MRKIAFVIVAAFVAIFVASCSSSPEKHIDAPNPSVNWEGVWTQSDESDTGTFVAVVLNGVITIKINTPDTSALYWHGTFPAQAQSTSITSVADKEANSASLLGSQADTKTFTYKDGVLSFVFEALGIQRTIHMEKS